MTDSFLPLVARKRLEMLEQTILASGWRRHGVAWRLSASDKPHFPPHVANGSFYLPDAMIIQAQIDEFKVLAGKGLSPTDFGECVTVADRNAMAATIYDCMV
jgi:hypothetical protein